VKAGPGRISATPVSHLAELGIAPAPRFFKKFQRIRPARLSEWLKESGMDDPDEALVLQSRQGDPAAFELLIKNHQRMIHSLTFRMTGSAADAEDLAQETFIRAHQNLDSYRGAAKFSTWLYRIALNICLNWRRRETRRFAMHVAWAETAGAPPSGIESPPEVNHSSQGVQSALLRLPAKQRVAIVLTVYDGLNHAEAAQLLNCSETTVSWRVFAARRKLRRWLAPAGENQ
jgi:RNA polymerase sigma-70 factor (ECF subfamily)